MKKFLSDIFGTIVVSLCLFIGWKYYQFTGTDDLLSQQCLFDGSAKIAKVKDKQLFCKCIGSQYKKNISFIDFAKSNKKMSNNAWDTSYIQCKRAYTD